MRQGRQPCGSPTEGMLMGLSEWAAEGGLYCGVQLLNSVLY